MPSYPYKLKLAIINDFNDGLSRDDIIDKYKPKYKTLTRYRTDTWIRDRESMLSMEEKAKMGKCSTQFKNLLCSVTALMLDEKLGFAAIRSTKRN